MDTEPRDASNTTSREGEAESSRQQGPEMDKTISKPETLYRKIAPVPSQELAGDWECHKVRPLP